MATLTDLQVDLRLKLNDANSRILTSAQQATLINEGLDRDLPERERFILEAVALGEPGRRAPQLPLPARAAE